MVEMWTADATCIRREPSEQADNANLVDNGDLPRN